MFLLGFHGTLAVLRRCRAGARSRPAGPYKSLVAGATARGYFRGRSLIRWHAHPVCTTSL